MNTLSLSTWIFDKLPLKEMAANIVKCGYSSVEVSGINWGEFVWDREELLDEFTKRGVSIVSAHCHHHATPELNAGSDFKDFCAFHEKFYASMKSYRNLIVVEHAPASNWALAASFRDQVKFTSDLCARYGFTCTYENLPHSMQGTPEDFDGFFNDKVKFTFDAAHAAYADLDPVSFKRHFRHLANVHVYDVHRTLRLGDWLPAGMGKMRWPEILAALKQSGYTGPLTIELCSDNTREILGVFKKTGAITESGAGVECGFAIHGRELIESMLANA